MELFLMRHADATETRGNDFARVLSEKGKQQSRAMGGWLREMRLFPMRVVFSPYPRAQETADLVIEELGGGSTAQPDERLAPGMQPDAGCEIIHELGGKNDRLCLVGHAPDLGRLASYLIGAKDAGIEMRKGAIAALETARTGFGGSTLQWLMHPKMLLDVEYTGTA